MVVFAGFVVVFLGGVLNWFLFVSLLVCLYFRLFDLFACVCVLFAAVDKNLSYAQPVF